MRAETISSDATANYVRALVRSSRGRLFGNEPTLRERWLKDLDPNQ
jgi:hypothetical protein